MNSKGALLGATTLAGRVFRDYCEAHRFSGVAWHLFGDDAAVLTASADGADVILPETPEMLEDFPLLIDFQAGRKAAVAASGTVLASGTSAPPEGAVPLLFGANESRLLSSGPCTAPHPLSTVLLRVLGGRPVDGLAVGHVVAVTSTEEEGKEGQDELFNQTVALINAGKFKPRVYKEQVAYNLVPSAAEGGLPARMRAELEAFLGQGWLTPVQTARAGAFFGAMVALHLEFATAGAKRACAVDLRANPALEWEGAKGRGLVHAVQEEGIFVTTAGETERSIQLWICTDPLQSGMAWNLANLADHFFQLRNTN